MTDYSHLIGPNTPPLFPTPWDASGNFVYDATGGTVATIATKTNGRDNAPDDRSEVARFIAKAVNEKIERDDFPLRIVFADSEHEVSPDSAPYEHTLRAVEETRGEDPYLSGYRTDVEYFRAVAAVASAVFYRIRPEAEYADALYPSGLKTDYVGKEYVRDNWDRCFVSSVPEEFRL